MEAIKPGSCKDVMESGDHRDEDDQCYEQLDMSDYSIIQPPSLPKTDSEEDDEHSYEDLDCLNEEQTMPLSSLSPIRTDQNLTQRNLAHNEKDGEADLKEETEEQYEYEMYIDISEIPPQSQQPKEVSPSLTSHPAEHKPPLLPSMPQPPLASTAGTLPLHKKHHTFSTAQKSASIPRDLSSLFERSLDDLSELTQSEIQVWMLLQMQKMVQKMEDVYETAPAILSPKLTEKQPIPSPPPQEVQGEIEEEHRDPHPTKRGANYVNMDDLEKALSGDPPPPLPPRTYKGQSSDEEKPKSYSLKKTNEDSTKNVYSLQPQGNCQ